MAEKPSHGYTGWRSDTSITPCKTDPGRRKKISLYLYGPPGITIAFETRGYRSGFESSIADEYVAIRVSACGSQDAIRAKASESEQRGESLPPDAELRPFHEHPRFIR